MRVVCLLIALIGLSTAWHPTGHFLTALIAQIELQRDEPELFETLESIVAVISPFTAEKDHKFVECAEFPDDIKYQNWKFFNSWHFEDHYFFKGLAPRTIPEEKQSMVWAIVNAIKTLNTNHPSKINQLLGKSFSLRYLIHLVGDIHQPLHNASMVTPQFPNGDVGGNLFNVKVPEAYNLHTLWDLCLKRYTEVRTPIDSDKFAYLMKTAQEITSEYTREKLKTQLSESLFENWSLEGLELAKTIAYDGINYDETPSAEYMERGFKIVKQQLALGGYRLADILKKLKPQNSNVEISQE